MPSEPCRGPGRLEGADRGNDHCRDNSTENSPLLMRGRGPRHSARSGFFSVGGNQFGECEKQRGLRQAIAFNPAVVMRFVPGVWQGSKREPLPVLLVMVPRAAKLTLRN